MYRVELLPTAARALVKQAPALQRRLGRRIDALAADPRPAGARKLGGADDVWRLRVGDYASCTRSPMMSWSSL